jgi:hypothetical protein
MIIVQHPLTLNFHVRQVVSQWNVYSAPMVQISHPHTCLDYNVIVIDTFWKCNQEQTGQKRSFYSSLELLPHLQYW